MHLRLDIEHKGFSKIAIHIECQCLDSEWRKDGTSVRKGDGKKIQVVGTRPVRKWQRIEPKKDVDGQGIGRIAAQAEKDIAGQQIHPGNVRDGTRDNLGWTRNKGQIED